MVQNKTSLGSESPRGTWISMFVFQSWIRGTSEKISGNVRGIPREVP